MQIPKNIIQIGTVDSDHKLYVEDYVHIFLKQYGKEAADFYLYGKIEKETDKTCCFIYGAVKQDGECDIIEKRYFADMERVGEAAGDGTEIWVFLKDGYSVSLENYFVFYEQNEGMQSYLIAMHQNRPGEKEIALRSAGERESALRRDTTGIRTSVQAAENTVKTTARDKAEKQAGNRKRTVLAAAMLLLCVLGIRTIEQYSGIEDIGNFFVDSDETERLLSEEHITETEAAEEDGFIVEENQITQPLSAEMPVMESQATENEELEAISAETEEVAEVIADAVEFPEGTIAITEASYTVKKGDNLAAICRAKYGNTDRIQEVIDINHLINPNHLYPGQKIILPD